MVASPRTPLRADRLRALNRPSVVTVGLDERGLPVSIGEALAGREAEWQGGSSGDRRVGGSADRGDNTDGPGQSKAVVEILETWRVDDEWWRERIHRRYVEVVLEGGAHVVLYEDEMTGQWFMQRP